MGFIKNVYIGVQLQTFLCAMAPVPRAKFHLYRSNVSPQRGEKNIFGPLSRRNIGRHAQRAGRPAGNNKLHSRLISGVHT